MSIKGYADKFKSADGAPDFATLNPVRESQYGLDVITHGTCQVIGADAAEAGSTTRSIVATAHAALVGDVISWTSGSLNTKEYRVASVSTNAIVVSEAMSVAPTAADTFNILRQKVSIVNSSGQPTIAATIDADKGTGAVSADTLRMVDAGRARGIAPVSYDHTVSVTTSAYTEIIASTAAEVTSLYVADTSGSFLILATGAAASEVAQVYLAPGFAGWIPLRIAASTRVSIKALDTATASGLFVISGFS